MGELVTVKTHRIDEETLGWWDPATRTIHLDDRLTPIERRCVLAHERIHAERHDLPCPLPWLDEKRERQVDAEAARRLIPLDALARALRWCADEHQLADDLHVTVDYVTIRLAGLTEAEKDTIERSLWGVSA